MSGFFPSPVKDASPTHSETHPPPPAGLKTSPDPLEWPEDTILPTPDLEVISSLSPTTSETPSSPIISSPHEIASPERRQVHSSEVTRKISICELDDEANNMPEPYPAQKQGEEGLRQSRWRQGRQPSTSLRPRGAGSLKPARQPTKANAPGTSKKSAASEPLKSPKRGTTFTPTVQKAGNAKRSTANAPAKKERPNRNVGIVNVVSIPQDSKRFLRLLYVIAKPERTPNLSSPNLIP